MTSRNPVSTSHTAKPRLNATERRAAQFAAVATKQADLKREAAERRLAREQRGEPATPTGRKTRAARRATAR
jgi:hypothetical protein